MIQKFQNWVYIQRKQIYYVEEISVPSKFTAASLIMTKTWKHPKCVCVCVCVCVPVIVYVYTIQLLKKKKMLPFVSKWMDFESIMLSEVSQIEKETYGTTSYMWN